MYLLTINFNSNDYKRQSHSYLSLSVIKITINNKGATIKLKHIFGSRAINGRLHIEVSMAEKCRILVEDLGKKLRTIEKHRRN